MWGCLLFDVTAPCTVVLYTGARVCSGGRRRGVPEDRSLQMCKVSIETHLTSLELRLPVTTNLHILHQVSSLEIRHLVSIEGRPSP
jgi:hypothetical protein